MEAEVSVKRLITTHFCGALVYPSNNSFSISSSFSGFTFDEELTPLSSKNLVKAEMTLSTMAVSALSSAPGLEPSRASVRRMSSQSLTRTYAVTSTS